MANIRLGDRNGLLRIYYGIKRIFVPNASDVGDPCEFVEAIGNADITDTLETDVMYSATARISAAERAKLIPGNIKNGVTVLGVTGSYEGEGGGSLFRALVEGTLTEVTAADLAGVTAIRENLFTGLLYLASVELPDSVTEIEQYAFPGCTSLSNLSLGGGLESIGAFAFYGCEALEDVTLPASLQDIDLAAFMGCSSLVRVTSLAVSPPVIGPETFDGADPGLQFYVLAGSVAAYKAAIGWSNYASQIQAIPT